MYAYVCVCVLIISKKINKSKKIMEPFFITSSK